MRVLRTFILLFCGITALNAQAQQLRFFEFGFEGLPATSNVIAATDRQGIIDMALAQLALPESQRHLFINGEIQYGTETNNPNYTWHFVTNAWEFAETSIELCDGLPTDIENDKEYWINTVGRFCPWGAFLNREIVPSEVPEDPQAPIRIYPNPTTDMLTIDASTEIREVRILDILGKPVLTHTVYQRPIDLSALPSGHYYIALRHSGGNSIFKIAKQ